MHRSLALALALALPTAALAQDEEAAEEVEEVEEADPIESVDEDERLEQAADLVDPDAPLQDRVAASQALADDPQALPFLRAALHARDATVVAATVEALGGVPTLAAAELLARVARDEASAQRVRILAVEAFGRHAQSVTSAGAPGVHAAAGDLLWELAADRDLRAPIRASAHQTLKEHYPDTLASRGRPIQPTGTTGAVLGTLANGAAVGVVLASVGVLGQSDAGPAIGGIGGGLIGLGTGALYAAQSPVTDGQGAAYASGVGWGITLGGFGASALVDRPNTPITYSRQWDARAALLLTGTAAGVATGAVLLRGDPRLEDVFEVDAAGYLGSQLAVAAFRLAEDSPSTGDWSVVALTGSAVGLGAGAALHPYWHLEPSDLLFAVALTTETTALGILMPTAADIRRSGWPHTGIHLGLAGGLALAEVIPSTPHHSGMMFYGALVGNGLGAGVPLLFEGDDPQPLAISMMAAGAVGTGAGYALGNVLQVEPGDWSMIAVGTSLVAAEATALGGVATDKGHITANQLGGIVLTSSSVAAAGFLAASPFVEPRPGDMALLGSSAVWGVWLGTMTTLAIDPDVDVNDGVLAATFTADGFLVAGGVLLLADVEPVDTLGAQLGGVTGATIFPLVATLSGNSDTRVFATASVLGTVVGMGAGGVITWVVQRNNRDKDRTSRSSLRWAPGGTWMPSAGPAVLPDGQVGVRVGVSVTGW